MPVNFDHPPPSAMDLALSKVAEKYSSRTGCTLDEAWEDVCDIVDDMKAADISVSLVDRTP